LYQLDPMPRASGHALFKKASRWAQADAFVKYRVRFDELGVYWMELRESLCDWLTIVLPAAQRLVADA
jgi:hypothetical protein